MRFAYEAPEKPIIVPAAQRQREAALEAWKAFYQRQVAIYELPKPEPPKPVQAATNHVPNWRESQEILKQLLAEGKLRTSR